MENDFIKGYQLVRNGKIDRELTPREIAKLYPDIKNESAFNNGIIDALADDDFRFRLQN